MRSTLVMMSRRVLTDKWCFVNVNNQMLRQRKPYKILSSNRRNDPYHVKWSTALHPDNFPSAYTDTCGLWTSWTISQWIGNLPRTWSLSRTWCAVADAFRLFAISSSASMQTNERCPNGFAPIRRDQIRLRQELTEHVNRSIEPIGTLRWFWMDRDKKFVIPWHSIQNNEGIWLNGIFKCAFYNKLHTIQLIISFYFVNWQAWKVDRIEFNRFFLFLAPNEPNVSIKIV